MEFLQQFAVYLYSQNISKATVKNYLADITSFIRWYEKKYQSSFNPSTITLTIIDTYKQERSHVENSELVLSARSLERHISSLRKFFHVLNLQRHISSDPFSVQTPVKEVDRWHIKEFKNYLYVYNSSDLTIKNYIIDVRQFLEWVEKVTQLTKAWQVTDKNILSYINAEIIAEYRRRLIQDSAFSPASINRKLSSLRKYLAWASQEGLIRNLDEEIRFDDAESTRFVHIPTSNNIVNLPGDEVNTVANITQNKKYSKFPPLRLMQKILALGSFSLDLLLLFPIAKSINQAQKILWAVKGKPVFDTSTQLAKQLAYINSQNPAKKTISSHLFRLRNTIPNIKKEFYNPVAVSTKYLPTHKKIWFHIQHTRPNWYRRYQNYTIARYFQFIVLTVFIIAVAFIGYERFISNAHNQPSLAAGLPNAPLRVLSFQGRLTDSNNNPITTQKTLRFMLYSSQTATGSAVGSGNLLWEEQRVATPDADGIFSANLGAAADNSGNAAATCSSTQNLGTVCGIPQTLFANNAQVWLGVTIGNDPELTPRQQLATVAYASNAETLQGLPPTSDTTDVTTNANAVLALNSSGSVIIPGSGVTTLQASAGTLKLSGQTTALTTNSGSNGSIVLSTDGSGLLDAEKPFANLTTNGNARANGTGGVTDAGAFEVTDLLAVVATSSGQSAVTIDQEGLGPVISASHSGVAVFTIDNSGNVTAAGTLNLFGTTATFGNGSAATLQTSGNQNLTLSAGSGQTNLNSTTINVGNGSATSIQSTSNQNLSLLAGSGTITLGTNTTGGNIQFFNSNNSVSNTGNLSLNGSITLSGANPTITTSTSNTNLALSTNGTGTLFLDSVGAGNIKIGTNAALLTIGSTSTNNIVFPKFVNAQGVLVTDANGKLLQGTAAGGSNLCLLSGSSIPTWGNCGGVATSGTSGFWQLDSSNTVLSPANSTYDLAIGGTATSSATFHVFGSNALAGTQPVASIAANTSFADLVIDNSGTGDLFTASASGQTRFGITNSGEVFIGSSPTLGNGVTPAALLISASSSAQRIVSINPFSTTAVSGSTEIAWSPNFQPTASVGSLTGVQNILTLDNSASNITSSLINVRSSIAYGSNFSGKVTNGYAWLVSAPAFGNANATVTNGFGFDIQNQGNSQTTNSTALLIEAQSGSKSSIAADIRGGATTSPVATISGNTTFAGLVVDNSGSGDIFTASSSGLTRFTIANNGYVQIGPAPTFATGVLSVTGTTALTKGINFNPTVTAANGTPAGVSVGTILSPSASATTLTLYGIDNTANLATSNFGVGRLVGLQNRIFIKSDYTGAIATTIANLINTPSISGSIPTVNLGVDIENQGIAGSLNSYGLYIATQSGSLNSYGIYAAGGPNVFINNGTTPVASVSGNTSFASLVVDNSNTNGDLFTASSSGLTRFVITQSGNIVLGADNTIPTALTLRGAQAEGSNVSGANITLDASNGVGTGGSGDLIFRTAAAFGGTTITQDNVSPVVHDASGSKSQFSWSHTISNKSNRLLIVNTAINAGVQTVNSITYGNQSLTKVNAVNGGTIVRSEMWYLKNPPIGTNIITVTLSGTVAAFVGDSVDFYNVDQNTPLGTSNTNSGSATTTSPNVTVSSTNTNQLVIDALAGNGADVYAACSPQSQLWLDHTSNFGASSTAPGVVSSTPMRWNDSGTCPSGTSGSDTWAIVAAPINPTTATGTDYLTDRLHITSSGNIGVGTSTPQAFFDIQGSPINGSALSIASISGNTTLADLVLDNSGTGDLFTASSSGLTRFRIGQNGSVLFQGDQIVSIGNGASGTGSNAVENLIGDEGSMLPNAGFESHVASTGAMFADGWFGAATSSGAVVWDSSTQAKGLASAKVTISGANTSTAFYSTCLPLALSANTGSYNINYYTKLAATNKVPTVRAYIDEYTSKGNCQSNNAPTFSTPVSTAPLTNTDTNWHTVTTSTAVTGATGSTNTWGRVHFFIGAGTAATTVNIDGVRLIESSLTGGVDYAENYPGDPNNMPEPGDVVSLESLNGTAAVKPTNTYMDDTTIGVISTQPGEVLDDGKTDHPVAVALAGRIPTNVSTKNGSIHIGDYLTTSDIPGVAVKAITSGQVIGKAMEDYSDPNTTHIGKIVMFVNLGYQNIQPELASIDDLSIFKNENSVQNTAAYLLKDSFGNTINSIGAFASIAVGTIKAGGITTQELTAKTINVTDSLTIAGQSLKDYIAQIVSDTITNSTLTSPLASVDEIHTNIISPLAKNSSVAIALGNSNITIKNTQTGQIVASITDQGDATFSGTLHAKKIIADEIDGLNVNAGTISANYITNVTNIYNSTPSASGSPQEPSGLTTAGTQIAQVPLQTNNINLASYSGQLNTVQGLNATTGMFQNGLIALGPSSLADVSVAGQLSVDGNMTLADNSINVLGADLQLQPLKQGSVSFEGGLVYIDPQGNMRVNGDTDFMKDVIVHGTLAAGIISPLGDGDLNFKLVDDKKLNVQTKDGKKILEVDQNGNLTASGSGSFASLLTKEFTIVRSAQADTSFTETVATASAGTATILKGQTERTIVTPFVKTSSLIYITPTTDTGGLTPYIARQVTEDSNNDTKASFTIQIDKASSKDITVNWWIVN